MTLKRHCQTRSAHLSIMSDHAAEEHDRVPLRVMIVDSIFFAHEQKNALRWMECVCV